MQKCAYFSHTFFNRRDLSLLNPDHLAEMYISRASIFR